MDFGIQIPVLKVVGLNPTEITPRNPFKYTFAGIFHLRHHFHGWVSFPLVSAIISVKIPLIFSVWQH